MRGPGYTTEFLTRCHQAVAGLGARGWVKDDPCVYCGRTNAELQAGAGNPRDNYMSLEHIIPESKGPGNPARAGLPRDWGRGARLWENAAAACRDCNTARGSQGWLRWLLREAERLGPSAWHPFRPGYVSPSRESFTYHPFERLRTL